MSAVSTSRGCSGLLWRTRTVRSFRSKCVLGEARELLPAAQTAIASLQPGSQIARRRPTSKLRPASTAATPQAGPSPLESAPNGSGSANTGYGYRHPHAHRRRMAWDARADLRRSGHRQWPPCDQDWSHRQAFRALLCFGEGREETASAATLILERARPSSVFLAGIAGASQARVFRAETLSSRTSLLASIMANWCKAHSSRDLKTTSTAIAASCLGQRS